MDWMEIPSCYAEGCIFCISSARGDIEGEGRAGPQGPAGESVWHEEN